LATVAESIKERAVQVHFRGTLKQFGPEAWLRGEESKQPVEVHKLAKTLVEISILEHMSSGV